MYHVPTFECTCDYIFSHLGVRDSSVDYPVVLSEPFGNPNYSRALLNELLFECYGAPFVAHGVDFLFAFLKTCAEEDIGADTSICQAPLSGIVISAGH